MIEVKIYFAPSKKDFLGKLGNYIIVFTVCLGMAQILTDSPTGSKQKFPHDNNI